MTTPPNKVTRETVPVANQVPPNFRDVVIQRIKEATFGISQQGKGNPQITLTTEIIDPVKITGVDGKTYLMDSLEVRYFLPTKITAEGAKQTTAQAQDRILSLHEKLKLPVELNPDNPDTAQYAGICFRTLLSSVEDIPQRKNPTTGAYEAILGGDGKPMKKGWKFITSVDDVLDRVENVASGSPY